MQAELATAEPGQRTGEARPTALAVRVEWGTRCLASRVLSVAGPSRFSIGPGSGEDFASGSKGRVELKVTPRELVLAFSAGVEGEVLRHGETPLSLSQLVRRGLAEEAPWGWELPLGRHDEVTLSLGSLTVEATPVRAPRRVSSLAEQVDYRFFNVLLGTALVASLLIVQAMVTGPQEDDAEPGPSAEAARWFKVSVTRPRAAQAPRAAADPALTTQPRERHGGGGPTKTQPTKAQDSGGRPSPKQLLAGVFSGPGAHTVLGGTGLGNELKRVLGGVVGVTDGLGGWAVKGDGLGGLTGGPVSIGRAGLPGQRRSFDPTLRRGPQFAPTYEVVPGPGCSSDGQGERCLDRETIRRLIRQHAGQIRYCYELLLQAAPTLQGKVAVRFHVTPAGTVDLAEVQQSTADRAELGACVVSRVRTWSFPGMPYGYTVTYPFIFRPAGE